MKQPDDRSRGCFLKASSTSSLTVALSPATNRRGICRFVKQVLPAAELRYYDGRHFVLDEFVEAIADAITETFSR